MNYPYPFFNPSLAGQNPSLSYPVDWYPLSLLPQSEDKQSYFLSLPEDEQLNLIRESQGSENLLREKIDRNRQCD